MNVTIADYESVQAQAIKLRAENEEVKAQISAAKKRSAMSSADLIDEIKSNCVELKVTISQLKRTKSETLERIKLTELQNYLQDRNMFEDSSIPDVDMMPEQVRDVAREVYALMEECNQQTAKRAFLDTQVNELSKKTKNLGRTGEQLQADVFELREKQRKETELVEASNAELKKLEAETIKLRSLISAASAPRHTQITQEDLKMIMKKAQYIEEEIQKKKTAHEKIVNDLTAKIDTYNRKIDDANSTKNVIQKKAQQKIWTLQNEINKRKGVVVHSSKKGSKQDSTKLFAQSKKYIEAIANTQQNNWEMEERVAFSRNSLFLMATEIIKAKFGRTADPNTNEKFKTLHKAIIRIAEIERIMKNLKKRK